MWRLHVLPLRLRRLFPGTCNEVHSKLFHRVCLFVGCVATCSKVQPCKPSPWQEASAGEAAAATGNGWIHSEVRSVFGSVVRKCRSFCKTFCPTHSWLLQKLCVECQLVWPMYSLAPESEKWQCTVGFWNSKHLWVGPLPCPGRCRTSWTSSESVRLV